MDKKNIAIVVKHLSGGGAEHSAARLSFMLDKLGYNVSFVLLYNDIAFRYKGNCYILNSDNKKSARILKKYHLFVHHWKYD